MKPPAPKPPKGFRKAIPLAVKLEALLINGPVHDKDGRKVCDIKSLDWDHCPPLQLRVWDPESGDTIPPANSPEHIFPMVKADHREKTRKDIPEIAKTKRLANDHDEFRRKILARECGDKRSPSGKIKSRGFQQRSRMSTK